MFDGFIVGGKIPNQWTVCLSHALDLTTNTVPSHLDFAAVPNFWSLIAAMCMRNLFHHALGAPLVFSLGIFHRRFILTNGPKTEQNEINGSNVQGWTHEQALSRAPMRGLTL